MQEQDTGSQGSQVSWETMLPCRDSDLGHTDLDTQYYDRRREEESVARTHCVHSARGSASSHYQEGSMNSKSLSPYHYHYHGDQV